MTSHAPWTLKTAVAAFTVLASLSALQAHAVTVSSATGLNVAITDNGYNGTLASMASHTLAVPALPGLITDVNVTVAMSHTWIGDLTLKLKSPTGTVVTLLNRPGIFTPDDGSQVGGDSSNLSARYPITYDDQAPGGKSAENMGNDILDNEIVGDPANGSADHYKPADDAYFGESLLGTLASFNGEDGQGDWTLYLGDSAAQDTGSLDAWSLDIKTRSNNAIPESNTAALGGLVLLALASRLTKRQRVAVRI